MRSAYKTYKDSKVWRLFWTLWILAVVIAALPAFAADNKPGESPAISDTQYPFEVSYGNAEEAVSRALTDKGIGDKVTARITSMVGNHKAGTLHAFDKPVTIDIKGLQFDKQSRRWNASLLFLADGDVITALPVSGHFEEVLEIPVLKREVRNNEVINEADIEVRDFPVTSTRTDTITDISELIGKSPLRTISPSRPIRIHEIASPALVKKNGLVQIRYSSPGMEITTTGQAMDDGAKGAVINVRNTASKKTVRAVVEDSNTVNILTSGTTISDNHEAKQLAGTGYATN